MINLQDYILCLSKVFYNNPSLIINILEAFPNYEDFKKGIDAFLLARGYKDKNRNKYADALEAFNLSDYKKKLDALAIKTIFIDDPNYPSILKEIHDPPQVLYYKGEITHLQHPCFGVVGPRFMTEYGEQVCRYLIKDLVPHVMIVSGMALGIDATAHTIALDAGCPTIAVLGSGCDVIYPKPNETLYHRIKDNGLILSEFPPGTGPQKYHFPQRNRLISGLCYGILLIEAGEKSGSLITARCAMEQNRDVFAVPGSIFSEQSKGVHKLIQDGVKCITGVKDILEDYPFFTEDQLPLLSSEKENQFFTQNQKLQKPQKEFETAAEKQLYEVLGAVPLTVDEIVQKSGLFVTEVLQYLTVFEINDIVEQLPGKQFRLNV